MTRARHARPAKYGWWTVLTSLLLGLVIVAVATLVFDAEPGWPGNIVIVAVYAIGLLATYKPWQAR